MNTISNLGTLGRGAIVLLVLALIAGGFWYASATPQEESQVMCTADAMQCPDGTWVGRSGPNCEFACPGAASAGGTLQGTVVAP